MEQDEYHHPVGIEAIIENSRVKSHGYFLEDISGVGATHSRPYMYRVWDKEYCLVCTGKGTCLGPSCMGPPPNKTVSKTLNTNNGVHTLGDRIPGLQGSFQGTSLTKIESSKTQSQSRKLSSMKYPCYISRKATAPSVKVC